MERDYVHGKYKGRILTDFLNEQRNHFPGAAFSLKKVMSLELNRTETTTVIHQLHIESADRLFAGVEQLRIDRMKSGGSSGEENRSKC